MEYLILLTIHMLIMLIQLFLVYDVLWMGGLAGGEDDLFHAHRQTHTRARPIHNRIQNWYMRSMEMICNA